MEFEPGVEIVGDVKFVARGDRNRKGSVQEPTRIVRLEVIRQEVTAQRITAEQNPKET